MALGSVRLRSAGRPAGGSSRAMPPLNGRRVTGVRRAPWPLLMIFVLVAPAFVAASHAPAGQPAPIIVRAVVAESNMDWGSLWEEKLENVPDSAAGDDEVKAAISTAKAEALSTSTGSPLPGGDSAEETPASPPGAVAVGASEKPQLLTAGQPVDVTISPNFGATTVPPSAERMAKIIHLPDHTSEPVYHKTIAYPLTDQTARTLGTDISLIMGPAATVPGQKKQTFQATAFSNQQIHESQLESGQPIFRDSRESLLSQLNLDYLLNAAYGKKQKLDNNLPVEKKGNYSRASSLHSKGHTQPEKQLKN
eukprot:GHVT01082076.1.p1 GENE.GHVT01082076.1~~GHVT01082076.1.p1  ORF type:complete len:308 (-),score=40.48 GHVT01082076.1:99-1022(-)